MGALQLLISGFLLAPIVLAQQSTKEYRTVDVCANNPYSSTLIQRNPESPGFFNDIKTWNGENYKNWITVDLRSAWIASCIFAGISLLSLLIFIIWRAVNCCCCGVRRKGAVPQYPGDGKPVTTPQDAYSTPYASGKDRGCWARNNTGKTMMVLKPIILIMALAAAALTAFAIRHAGKGMAEKGWNQVDYTVAYVTEITDQVQYVLSNVSQASNTITGFQRLIQDKAPNDPAAQQIITASDMVKKEIDQLTREYAGQAANVQAEVSGRVNNLKSNYEHGINRADMIRWAVTLAVFCVTLLFLLILVIAMFSNIPTLFCFSVFVIHVMIFIYFLGGVIFAFVVGSGKDICPATETVVTAFMDPKYTGLLNYYFFGIGGPLEDALYNAGIIDIRLLTDQLTAAANRVIIAGKKVAEATPGGGALSAVLTDADNVLINSMNSLNRLKQIASHEAFIVVYSSSKGFVCCEVLKDFTAVWLAETVAGWIMMVMVWMCHSLITQYDKYRGPGCCSCSPISPFRV